jgi:hypothetical protein
MKNIAGAKARTIDAGTENTKVSLSTSQTGQEQVRSDKPSGRIISRGIGTWALSLVSAPY